MDDLNIIPCGRCIIVNRYKILFLSSNFSSQPNKGKHKYFLSLQPNTCDGKHKSFWIKLRYSSLGQVHLVPS